MKNKILVSVYVFSAVVVLTTMALLCLLFKWDAAMSGLVISASLLISVPSTVSLHFIFWLTGKINATRIFLWIMLLAFVPLLAVLPAELFADRLPGDVWLIVAIGMIASYTAIFSHGISIAQIFNSVYEAG